MTNSEKMLACLDQQDLARADKYFKRALREDEPVTLLDLAEYLEAIGFYPQAKRAYEQLQELYPHVNLSLAQMASEDGQVEEAFLYLNEIDETSPDYVTALLVMADLYDAEGLTDVARDKLLLASQLTDEPLVLFGLAELEMDLEDYASAIATYAKLDNRALLAETGVSTYERIGRAYAGLGKFEPAIEFLEKALEIEHDDQTLFELATLYYEEDNVQRANLLFQQLETLSPDYEGYEYVYALSLQADHRTAEALRLTQQALQKNQFDGQLLLLASQLAYETKDEVLAETYLKEALRLDGGDDQAQFRLANLYLDQGRYEEVVGLNLAESANPMSLWFLAQAYDYLEDEAQALTLYDQVAGDLSDNPEFLLAYAKVLRASGQQGQLQAVLTAYLALVPDDLVQSEQLLAINSDQESCSTDKFHPCSCCLEHDK